MTGGGRNKFWGHEKFILCEFERGTGAREIYPSLDQINKVRSKDSKKFSCRNRKFKRFFRPKTGDLQKKKKKKKRSSLKLQGISGRNRKFKRFFRPETDDLQKKKGLHPKNVLKSGVSPQKTPIWASICTPVAQSLLISSGHSPGLGGHNFCLGGTSSHLGGHGPGMPLRGVGSVIESKTTCPFILRQKLSNIPDQSMIRHNRKKYTS